MPSHKFNDEDKQKMVEFLNFIANKAEFKLNTQDVIKYFRLLNHMQSQILPKIEKNVLEVVEVIEEEEDSKDN